VVPAHLVSLALLQAASHTYGCEVALRSLLSLM